MFIKLNRTLRSLKGQELEISYPTLEQINALPKTEDGKPDRTKLPRDSVKNALLDALAYYETKDKKDMFKIFALAQKLNEFEGDDLEVDDVYKDIINKALDGAIAVSEPGNPAGGHGLFQAWFVAQVMDACGILDLESKE